MLAFIKLNRIRIFLVYEKDARENIFVRTEHFACDLTCVFVRETGEPAPPVLRLVRPHERRPVPGLLPCGKRPAGVEHACLLALLDLPQRTCPLTNPRTLPLFFITWRKDFKIREKNKLQS